MLRTALTENGTVRGIPGADPRITAFKGIPFAKPPVGKLRWRAPEPAEDWEGVLDCSRFAPISMQEIPGKDPDNIYTREWHVDPEIPMSEDCLYLNVWTPARTGEERYPVMVWFFGGGFNCGYTAEMEFDGERIARRGIVLVSVNYRVGVFGFLTHPELMEEDPDGCYGNYGMLDQRAGLEWVQKNIGRFGGDPENVTIFGQSAGAGSVICQLTSPMNAGKGLFHKAIFQSGGGLRAYGQGNFMLTLKEAEQNGIGFFEKNGLASLKQARDTDAKTICRMGIDFGFINKWSPTVDGRFLTEDPSDALAAGRYPDIPLLFGCTGGEYELRGKPAPETVEDLERFAREKFGDEWEEFLRGEMEGREYISRGEGKMDGMCAEILLRAFPYDGQAYVHTRVEAEGFTFCLGGEIRFDSEGGKTLVLPGPFEEEEGRICTTGERVYRYWAEMP